MTLGPISLSLPELAQALTQAGMPTVASPALRERGAFVFLKDRSPDAVRKLLGEALGVAFRPEAKAWRMVVDPEAKERDRLRLIAYKRQAADAARAWAAEADRVRAGRGYAAVERGLDESTAAAAAVKAGDPRAEALIPPLLAAQRLLSPPTWLGRSAARDSGVLSRAIAGGADWSLSADEAERSFGLPVARLRPEQAEPTRTFAMSARFDAENGTLTLGAAPMGERDATGLGKPWKLASGGYTLSSVGATTATFPVEGGSVAETFARMGQTAALARFSPVPALPDLPVEKEPVARTLSNVLEALGGKGLESVMELSPRFELLPSASAPPYSLRRVLTVGAEPEASLAPLPLWLKKAAGMPLATAEVRERRFPWRGKDQEGVWLLVDPFAFLDRALPVSPVPYLVAERILRKLPEDAANPGYLGDVRLPPWPLLTELARALPPAFRGERYGYRGLYLSAFADLLPVARLVEAIPPKDRPAFWKAAKTKDGARWETREGTLTLTLVPLRFDPNAPPGAQVNARWQGADGSGLYGGGMIDPRGLFDEPPS